MKNVRFFSNKIVLVAIVVVSSIMMMSFKSTSTKKVLAYSMKVKQLEYPNLQEKSPQLTAKIVLAVVDLIGFMDNFASVCYAPDYLKTQEDEVAKDNKMSKF